MELLTDTTECFDAYRRWVSVITNAATLEGYGWIFEGAGVVFSNYGHGAPGEVEDQVMLGADPQFRSGVVKIVQPEPVRGEKGKLTAIARDQDGNLVLLRQGWLKKNLISDEVRERFAELTGLTPVEVEVLGRPAKRDWYVVANLGGRDEDIVAQTIAFTLACTRGRAKTGGGQEAISSEDNQYSYGMDEKGRTVKVKRSGGSVEVLLLHAYVYEALKKELGGRLKRPKRSGFEVDGIVESANVLIEIKTGLTANDLHTGVGQLTLYPSLIGLSEHLERVLLLPDSPVIRPVIAAALDANDISIFTYSIGKIGKRPEVRFSAAFLDRCRTAVAAPG